MLLFFIIYESTVVYQISYQMLNKLQVETGWESCPKYVSLQEEAQLIIT